MAGNANQRLLTALSNVKLLTTTVMVDNLAEKVDKCPLNWGCQVIVYVKLGQQILSVIRSSGISAIQRLLKYWSKWKDSRDFQNCSLYPMCPGVFVKQGSTVFVELYCSHRLLAISFVPGLLQHPLLIGVVWSKGHSMVNTSAFPGCQLTRSWTLVATFSSQNL